MRAIYRYAWWHIFKSKSISVRLPIPFLKIKIHLSFTSVQVERAVDLAVERASADIIAHAKAMLSKAEVDLQAKVLDAERQLIQVKEEMQERVSALQQDGIRKSQAQALADLQIKELQKKVDESERESVAEARRSGSRAQKKQRGKHGEDPVVLEGSS